MSARSRALRKAKAQSRAVDMTSQAAALSGQSQQAALRAAYQAGAAGAPWPQGSPAGNWFGPGAPIPPTAPPEVAGRTWDFPANFNAQISTRPYSEIQYSDLRILADTLDVLRIVIETRKDQMEKLSWSIIPQLQPDGTPVGKTNPKDITDITSFLAYPDGEHDWGAWLRILLEDLFVIDAPTVYCKRTYGNKLLALRPLDGAGIKRVIDDWGCTPEPPIPAYQHILHGLPAVDYTTDDVIWLPRNPRSNRSFGYGPVEQIINTVDISIRKQYFMRDWFSEGNVPQALIGTPDEWTTDQISKFQKYWDAMLAGNLEARRHAFFVPGGVAKTFIATKEPDLTGKTDEWLARVVCFAFSISPQPFISMMNRSTAETAHEAALAEGLYPVMNWVKKLINKVIARFWPGCGLEFKWNDDAEVDKTEQEQILTGYVTKGVMKINEARDTLGLDPVPGGDQVRVLTATGFTLVDLNDDAPTAGEAADQKSKAAEALANKPAPVVAAPGATKPAPAPAAKEEAPATKAAGGFCKVLGRPTAGGERAVRRGYWDKV